MTSHKAENEKVPCAVCGKDTGLDKKVPLIEALLHTAPPTCSEECAEEVQEEE